MGIAIIVILLILVVVALAVTLPASPLRARARRQRLRRRFGPEYERIAAETGDAGEADRELVELEHVHAGLELRTLPEDEVSRHRQAWTEIQVRFVDDPRDAARLAEREIGDVLTELGYPDEDRDRQLALASVEHAQPVSGYRDARRLVYAGGNGAAAGADEGADTNDSVTGNATRAAGNGSAVSDADTAVNAVDTDTDADTESLRQALLRYRSVFEDLVGGTTNPAPTQQNGKVAQT
jgi:hypothetical protein